MKRYLGVDIGGSSVKYGIVTGGGDILSTGGFRTGSSCTLPGFATHLEEMVEMSLGQGVVGIGVSTLGIVHAETGDILGGAENALWLGQCNLRKLIRKVGGTNLPVAVLNDAKAVALGEGWLGAAKGVRDYACVTLGTGVGGAFVLGGRLLEGAHFRAGEIAYCDYLSEDDYIEKNLSTIHFLNYAAEKLRVAELGGIEFIERVRAGDSACTSLLEEWMDRLAAFLANFIAALDVELIIIGGAVSRDGDVLMPVLRRQVETHLPHYMRGQTRIEAARLANQAGMLGAVAYLLKKNNSE